MTKKTDQEANSYFDCTDNERAAFELGIKLGALFHQFIGTPVSSKNLEILEKAIEQTTERQAFVTKAEVKILPKDLENRTESVFFDYTTLSGDMLDVRVHVDFKGIKAVGRLEYISELDYPLMYIESLG